MTKPQTPLIAVPQALVAWAVQAFAVVFVLAFAAHAQPAAPAGISPDKGSVTGVIPWSAIMDATPPDGPGRFDKPALEGIGNAFKEAVRPIHESLSQSGVLQSIREFDADIGGGNQRESAGQRADGTSVDRPYAAAPAKSAQQLQREQLAASVMTEKLIKEAAPWAVGLAALFGLGYLAKAWLDHLHRKAAGPGARRRAARKKSRRSATGPQSLEGTQTADTAPGSLSQETGGNGNGNRRDGSNQSSGSSSGSSGASGSSSASSGRRRHRSHRPQL